MKRRIIFLLLLALCVLLIVETAQAMHSAQYELNWFTPLTTGGGGTVSSTHYIVSFSLGQTAINNSASSTHYGIRLGFWADLGEWFYHIFLPAIQR